MQITNEGFLNKNKLKTILEENGIFLSKNRGQNFLIDKNYRNRIITLINNDQIDKVIEIGAGLGVLTLPLAECKKEVISYEIDNKVYNYLSNINTHNNLQIHHKDFLKEEEKKLNLTKDYILCGNIPYNISSVILERILNLRFWKNIYFLVQKDFYNRLKSKPNKKDYSSLSVIAQTFFKIKFHFDIPSTAFFPEPKVESSFISLEFNNKDALNYIKYKYLIQSSFQMRRKKLINNLKKMKEFDNSWIEKLEGINIDYSKRAESFSKNDFEDIYIELGDFL